MDKFLLYIRMIEDLGAALAGVPNLPPAVVEQAQKVVAAAKAFQFELAHPNSMKIWDYIKHHGNLPGTPESRGER